MNSPKRLLILGASHFQVPLIMRAKEMGLTVVTTDFLPANPGHKLADCSYQISTTDSAHILKLARETEVDAVMTFASDPALPAVAFASSNLGLPGPSIQATDILCSKDNFRTVLGELGLLTPRFRVIGKNQAPPNLELLGSAVMVKPVDSSGSKGITFARLPAPEIGNAIDRAIQHSRVGRCIIEEYIEGDQIHGDAYIRDGKICHQYFGDHAFFTGTNNFIPVSTTWPSKHASDPIIQQVLQQVEAVCNAAGYLDGPLNVEARLTSDGQACLIEVGPRNGGNLVPIIQSALTGFDFLGNLLADTLGQPPPAAQPPFASEAGAYYVLHSPHPGILQDVRLSGPAKDCLYQMVAFKQPGDSVAPYTGSNTALGILLFRFPSELYGRRFMSSIDEHVVIAVSCRRADP